MTWKIFDPLSGANPTPDNTSRLSPQTGALLRALQQKSQDDPLAAARTGAEQVLQRVLDAMGNQQGVHVESLLCSLGAMAGYACQAYLRAQAVARGMPETAPFLVVDTQDGKQFFFGDSLNRALANSQYSVWGLASGAAQYTGATEFPDLDALFNHSAAVLGTDDFGIPRIPEESRAGDTPLNYLKSMWPTLLPLVKSFCPDPVDWPILYGLAVQRAILLGEGVIAPELALKIVMESAIPMSKVDLVNC